RQHELQALPQRRVGLRIGEQLRDRPPLEEDARLLDPGAREVARVRARDERRRKHDGNADQHPGQQAAPDPGPVRRTTLDHGIHRSPMRCLAPSASSVRYAESRCKRPSSTLAPAVHGDALVTPACPTAPQPPSTPIRRVTTPLSRPRTATPLPPPP